MDEGDQQTSRDSGSQFGDELGKGTEIQTKPMSNNGHEGIASTGPLTNGPSDTRDQTRLTQPSVSENQNSLYEEVERLRLKVEHLRDEQKSLQGTTQSNDLYRGDDVEDHEGDDSDARDPADRRGVLHLRPVKLVACNIENDSRVCYQSACLEQFSDYRGPKLRNFVRECARGCCASVTCGGRG
jgi:hypothetical protein